MDSFNKPCIWITLVILVWGSSLTSCGRQKPRPDEIEIVMNVTHSVIWKCLECHPGRGLSIPCGTSVAFGVSINCVNCVKGVNYSDTSDYSQCKSCRRCSPHQKLSGNCTTTEDASSCLKKCDKGFYWNNVKNACHQCSYCCGEQLTHHEKQCEDSGLPKTDQCRETQCYIHSNNKEPSSNNVILVMKATSVCIFAVFYLLCVIGDFFWKKCKKADGRGSKGRTELTVSLQKIKDDDDDLESVSVYRSASYAEGADNKRTSGFFSFYIKANSPQKVTSTVTSEGGELVGESVKLICPPGAVYNSLSVCVTLEDPSKYYGLLVLKDLENDVMFGAPIISLEPSGHLFFKPLPLVSKFSEKFNWDDVLILHGSKTDGGKIYWQDISHNSKIDEANTELVIEIEHFSIIAILRRLSRSSLLRTKYIVSTLNLQAFNYNLSVLLNRSNPSLVRDELALLFVTQDVYHEKFYREDEASSALMQLKKQGFEELHVRCSLEEKGIYNNETLQVDVRLGEDYKLGGNQQETVTFTVHSYEWWHEGKVVRIPLERNKNATSLCGKVSVRGEYGHKSERNFNERELCGYLRSLLGVRGDIFNVIPIGKIVEMPKESLNHLTKPDKDEDEQLEIVLRYWSEKNDEDVAEDLATLRKDLESLKQEDYRVTRRGQMHIKHLRQVANKILGLQFTNADLQKYFIRKIQNLCKNVLRDCCIELEVSAYDVERAASSTNHAQYLIQSIENHCPLPPEIKEKYQEVCSLFDESAITNFLSIVPYLVQNIKEIFVDHRMTEVPQNGLRGLPREKLDEFVTTIQSAERNDDFFRLLSNCSRILELLCLENYKEPNAEIEKWGESLAVLPMLNYLKPYFQHCSQDVRLYKRLELLSRCLRENIDDRDRLDQFFVHDFSNVLSSLIHFAKIDPSKEVRFELNGSTNLPYSRALETVKYDKLENTYSQVFRIKRDTEDELQLHATARVYNEGEICTKGTFHSTIMVTSHCEKALLNCHISHFHEITATKLEDRESGNICVVFCTSRKEKLLELLDVLRKELRENAVDLSKSKVTQCPLWMRSHVTSKEDAVLSLRLVYKSGSEAVVLDSKDFVTFARSSHGQYEGWNEEPILLDKQICFAADTQLEEENSVQESNVNVPSEHMQIFIRTMEEKIITIAVNPSDCIWNVKTVIHKLYQCPPNSQRLVFGGMRLEDERSLRDCNIQNGSYLYLVQRLRNSEKMPINHLQIPHY